MYKPILLGLLVFSFALFAKENLSLVELVKPDQETLDWVSQNYEIVKQKSNGNFEAIVPKDDLSKVKNRRVHFEILIPNIQEASDNRAGGYKNFKEVERALTDYESHNKDWVSLETYGRSQNNYPLYALRLHAHAFSPKEEVLITAATHGNEIITTEVLLGILDHFIKEKPGSRSRNILDRYSLYFVPVVNPDGFVAKERYDHGIDPNRSYPWPGNPNKQSSPAIKPLIEFFNQHDFKATLDFHAYGRVVMYPWAYTKQSVPADDLSLFERLADKMAFYSGYRTGQISKVMYVAQGSSADYYYWKKKSKAFAIEMGDHFAPPASQIPTLTAENLEMVLHWLEML